MSAGGLAGQPSRWPERGAEIGAGRTGRRLIVFARVPRLGAVKTRLARAIGEAAALALHRELLVRTLQVARCAFADSLELCIAGSDSDGECAALAVASGASLTQQCGESLGERMSTALQRALDAGSWPVLIGSDVPSLSAADLRAAFEQLRSQDAVFAPTEDGGYALIGCRREIAPAFDDIAWGSASVMAATRGALRRAGIGWVELRTVWDVDDVAGLSRWRTLRANQPAHLRHCF